MKLFRNPFSGKPIYGNIILCDMNAVTHKLIYHSFDVAQTQTETLRACATNSCSYILNALHWPYTEFIPIYIVVRWFKRQQPCSTPAHPNGICSMLANHHQSKHNTKQWRETPVNRECRPTHKIHFWSAPINDGSNGTPIILHEQIIFQAQSRTESSLLSYSCKCKKPGSVSLIFLGFGGVLRGKATIPMNIDGIFAKPCSYPLEQIDWKRI